MKKNKIEGMVAAAFTPMKRSGDIDLERIPALTDYLIRQHVQGIYVCGSTGEGPSLTGAERKAAAEAFVKASQKRVPVLVHVGHNSVKEARELSAHAREIGADYISSVAPSYFKITTVEGLVHSLAEIAASAPELPFYYYHIPRLTGMAVNMPAFLEEAGRSIPSLAGIKFTSPELHEYQACLNAAGEKYDILYGVDEMLLGALSVGAKGYIGSTYGFLPLLYRQLRESFDSGNLQKARALQFQSVEVVRIIVKYGGLAAQKVMMKLSGVDCGNVRSPLQGLSAEEEKAMEKDLHEAGFFDIVSQMNNQ
ncbi:MAG: dihydrodipicolinate synthase family protein [Chitinophagaceae bacterium]|nr:dihydrodipicolinate synthase family protein [Chitinophagaceae bacterium]